MITCPEFRREFLCASAACSVSSISFNSRLACSVLRERSSAASASSLFPFLKSQRGDSLTNRLPMDKQQTGRKRGPEDTPPCLVLKGKKGFGVAGRGYRCNAVTKVDAAPPPQRNPALAATEKSRFLCLDSMLKGTLPGTAELPLQPGRHSPLQQPAHEQRSITVRQGDDRNADNERYAAQDHHRLAAQPVHQQPRKQRGRRRSSRTAATMIESCAAVRPEVASR